LVNSFQNILILLSQSFSKRPAVKVLRVLIAAVPILYIFSKINFERLLHAADVTAWWTVPLLGMTGLAGMSIQGIRWWVLMRPFASSLSLRKALGAHFRAVYYSIMLPSSAAQNVVRAVLLSKDEDYSISWASSWISGVLGMLTIAMLSLYGLIGIRRSELPPGFFESVVSAFCVLFVLVGLSFSKRFTGPFRKIFGRILPVKLMAALENIREAVYRYKGKGSVLVIVLLITLAMQLVLFGGACLTIYGISGKLLISESFLFLPVIETLCTALPIAPNGIGVREALLALMFRQVGLSTEQLGIYIMLSYFSILLKLVGGIPLLLSKNKAPVDTIGGQAIPTQRDVP
jgi:uncharacterized protein (TIRG00374 family)